ncbi:flagellar hook-length control protein FliK [Limimaricola hongkongensis]|uniref:Flagellar hook-length control protein-like C-terminal domain-containing protein n=1 Tax=Limimaricola hongkongensis DSM 17492 TaxID=1122180 RepID=A0A017HBT7_9RHOB|nr:flagellar hook-length control protein FliK [Limimaricola hongkongensis]EYD71962.1 hypothetical protein Lokhon_02034 [Limimaricola hongkongensis DSM 17492]
MAQQDQGAGQAGPPAAASSAAASPLDRLLAAAGQILRDGAAGLRAAGDAPEAGAAILAETQTALQEMIAGFDVAQGTDLGAGVAALLSGGQGADPGAGVEMAGTVGMAGATIAAIVTAIADASGGTVESVVAAMKLDAPAPGAVPVMMAAPAGREAAARPAPALMAPLAAPAAPPASKGAMPGEAVQGLLTRGAGQAPGAVTPAGPDTMAAPGLALPGGVGAGRPPEGVAQAAAPAAPTVPAGTGSETAWPGAAAPAGAPQAETPGAPRGFAALIGEAIARSAEAAPEAPVSGTDAAARETELPGGATASRPQEAVPGPRAAMLPPPVPAPAPAPPSHGFARALTGQIKGTVFAEGRTRIALTPGGLGEIEIDLTQEAGQLRVVIRAENQAVLQALRDDRDGLAALLGEAGAGVDDDRLSFDSFERRDDAPPRRDRPGGSSAILTDAAPEEAAAPDPAQGPVSQGGEGRLDMFT